MRRPRRHRALAALALPLALAWACAGAREEPPTLPSEGLDHGTREAVEAAFSFTDTTRLALGAGTVGAMEVVRTQQGRAHIAYEPLPDGAEAHIRLTEYEATAANPRQGMARATAADLEGDWRVRLDGRGVGAVLERPRVGPAALALAETEALAHQFFIALPGGPADVGTQWVDTVRITEPGALDRRSTVITTYTIEGETVADGRAVLVIRTATSSELEARGVAGGVMTRQNLTATLRGRVLWDAAASVLVEREEAGELSGSLSLPDSGGGALLVTGTYTRSVRRVD